MKHIWVIERKYKNSWTLVNAFATKLCATQYIDYMKFKSDARYQISLDRILIRVCDDCAKILVTKLECQRLANKHDKETV